MGPRRGHFSKEICLKAIDHANQVWWHTPVIPATWAAEIGRTEVQAQLRQKVSKTPSQPIKAGCGGVCLSQLRRKPE
jgi:hypothetical protein